MVSVCTSTRQADISFQVHNKQRILTLQTDSISSQPYVFKLTVLGQGGIFVIFVYFTE